MQRDSPSLHPGTGENSPHSTPTSSTSSHSKACGVTAISLCSEGIPPLGNYLGVDSVVEKGPLGEGTKPGSLRSSVREVLLAWRDALESEVIQPQICPKVCKTCGTLLQVCSLNYPSGQRASPASTARVCDRIPWEAAVCPCSISRGGICFSVVPPCLPRVHI